MDGQSAAAVDRAVRAGRVHHEAMMETDASGGHDNSDLNEALRQTLRVLGPEQ